MAILARSNQVNFKRQEVVARSLTTNPNSNNDTVTQITSRATGVTVNTTAGQITTDTTSLAAAGEATFTVTNNKVTAKSVPVVAVASGATGTTLAYVSAVALGSFDITVANFHASTAETGALVINFVILGVE
jgi:hypothetical protein